MIHLTITQTILVTVLPMIIINSQRRLMIMYRVVVSAVASKMIRLAIAFRHHEMIRLLQATQHPHRIHLVIRRARQQ